MPQQTSTSIENNFTKGLITESTGLNFPENAATDTDNCTYTLVGDVLRREGIDFEVNHTFVAIDKTNAAINTYRWTNVGGDGNTQLLVGQVGATIYFWNITNATATLPVSTKSLATTINLALFLAAGGAMDGTSECTFSSGNGYLFIFHPSCDPIYCTYTPTGPNGAVTGNVINLQIRDLTGIAYHEGPTNTRPLSLTPEHQYNLMNQGWSSGPTWVSSFAQSWVIALGSIAFTVSAGLVGVTPGQLVSIQVLTSSFPGIPTGTIVASATVTSYSGTTLTLNVGGVGAYAGFTVTSGNVYNVEVGYINTFKSTTGVFPSNADVWWYFKNSSNTFDPATTVNQVTLGQGNAPQGHYLFNPFYQDRSAQTGIAGLTTISTTKRPTNGAWFQGRVWYTGVEASFNATGDAPFFTWTESIYFSQVVTQVADFGKCYQENDLTSENLFDLLPTDGGVIVIQGIGTIYKLFPTQNGLIVFGANGVKFITGSQGIGFSATDYTITDLSDVRSISSTSFVNVMGLPYFWNEEGIYAVEQGKNGGLAVNPITVGTILSFYDKIPYSSKKYVHGAYHPIDYVIQWVYRGTESISINDRYNFNKILNYNVYNKAFFPYTVDTTTASINSIVYVATPGSVGAQVSSFKHLASIPDVATTLFAFADEHSTDYLDWSGTGRHQTYVSYFVTGYKLRGQAIKRFQPTYIQVYSRTNGVASAYKIQGLWDFANSRSSGRWSSEQRVINGLTRFDTVFRRHKIRGHGYALQFKITSVDEMPFDIQGWAIQDTVNAGT